MAFEAKCLFDASSGSGSVIHFDYLEQGNLLVLHNSKHQQKCECISLYDLYSDFVEPLLVTIVPDASGIVLALSNEKFLILPIKHLLNVNWAHRRGVCSDLLIFSLSSNCTPCLRIPTAITSYISELNGRVYIIYGLKSGFINVVDLQLQKLTATLYAEETITDLELYTDTASHDKYLIVSHFTGSQTVITLETATKGWRENLSDQVAASDFIHRRQKFTARNADRVLTSFDSENNTLCVLRGIDGVSVMSLPTPPGSWMTFYSKQMTICVTGEQEVKICLAFDELNEFETLVLNCGTPCQPLGMIPVAIGEIKVDNCMLVNSTGIYLFEPASGATQLALNLLNSRNFSKTQFERICSAFDIEHWALYEKLLLESITANEKNNTLDGVILLGLQMAFPLSQICSVLNSHGEFDAMIPFLNVRCHSNFEDMEAKQLLFDTYVKKLWITDTEGLPVLEAEIRMFLLDFDVSPDALKVLLKHNLLSCVNVLLMKNKTTISQEVASYLAEHTNWTVYDSMQLLRTLTLIHWSALESSTRKLLAKLLASFLTRIQDFHQIVMALNLASTELKSEPHFFPSFIFAGIRAQQFIDSRIRWKPTGCGSNFAALVADDRSLWVWGEFVAGNLRTKNLSASQTQRSLHSSIDGPLFRLAKEPRRIHLTADLLEDPIGICTVECGTEHILLLDSRGNVYSIGKNRFGQCGVGHCEPVSQIAKVKGNFGTAKIIKAGHYHSALVDSRNRVWMWGWGVHGQLGFNTVSNVPQPVAVRSLTGLEIREMALGMAHSLFLTSSGAVIGFGYMDNGELLADPSKLDLPGGKSKSCRIQLLQLPDNIVNISCGYFQGLAINHTGVYQWGECPQTLKMNAFWQKHRKDKVMEQSKKEDSQPSNQCTYDVLCIPAKEHFNYKKVTDWDLEERPIKQLSCGYNHSAILTETGEIFTWGRALDKQLGHGNKVDKQTPSKLSEPFGVCWCYVNCGRNTTLALSARGECFVWGRNDRNQIGVKSLSQQQAPGSTPKRYVLKSASKGKRRPIEVPVSQCVDKPTPVLSVMAATHHSVILEPDFTIRLNICIEEVNQSTLCAVARLLRIHPVNSLLGLKVQLVAGDLLPALQGLSSVYNISTLTRGPDPERSDNTSDQNASCTLTENDVDELMDKVFQLVHSHPAEEIKVVALLVLLSTALPVCGRIASSLRLCRLIGGHVSLPNEVSGRKSASPTYTPHFNSEGSSMPSSSDYCTSATQNRRMLMEAGEKERAVMLKRARLPGPAKIQQLQTKAAEIAEKYSFFHKCGHFERKCQNVLQRQDTPTRSNERKLCTRCNKN